MHLTFYSRKEQRVDTIGMVITPTGWKMSYECYHGSCDPDGMPHLQRCLAENYTAYPSAFTDALAELWEAARENNFSEARIQTALDRYSAWIQSYDKTRSARIDWAMDLTPSGK